MTSFTKTSRKTCLHFEQETFAYMPSFTSLPPSISSCFPTDNKNRSLLYSIHLNESPYMYQPDIILLHALSWFSISLIRQIACRGSRWRSPCFRPRTPLAISENRRRPSSLPPQNSLVTLVALRLSLQLGGAAR